MPDYTITEVVNIPSADLPRRGSANQFTSTNKFGLGSDFTQFDDHGHMTMEDDARTYRDEKNDLLAVKSLGTGVSIDTAEGTLDFTTAANLSDYAYLNVQLNHDRDETAQIFPHLHWFQNSNAAPNWLLQYRWQLNGGAKVTTWTNYKMSTCAFTYVSGTIMQICYGAGITPPAGSSVSDIIQCRIIRDNANTSTVFAGADTYSGDAEAVSFDIHVAQNSIGSDEEYVK